MNRKKIAYTEAPENVSKAILEGEVIPDFLPPPEELVRYKISDNDKQNFG